MEKSKLDGQIIVRKTDGKKFQIIGYDPISKNYMIKDVIPEEPKAIFVEGYMCTWCQEIHKLLKTAEECCE